MRYILSLLLFVAPLQAQPQAPQPIVSPLVNSDGRVTFRFKAPNAKEVFLAREGAQRVAMQKDEQGVWSVTTDPLDPSMGRRNMERFRDATLLEVLPQVEKQYRVSADRKQRAIAGLSMGGAESLFTGLNALDRFAWVGAFSSGGMGEDYTATFPKLDAKANEQLRLLWIGCGREDRLIEGNRKFLDWLKSKEIRYTWVETPGAHTWMVWRRYLSEFTPLLFR
jgi:enterochelin esterase family protein